MTSESENPLIEEFCNRREDLSLPELRELQSLIQDEKNRRSAQGSGFDE